MQAASESNRCCVRAHQAPEFAAAMPYWLVSLPLVEKRRERTWEVLQERTTGMSKNSKFNIPELRVGTLDTLMQLSDDLAKTNNLMEVVVTKLRRQIHELSGSETPMLLKVKGQAIEDFMSRFAWNEAKYQAKRPLRELVDVITEGIARIEDDLKVSAMGCTPCIVRAPSPMGE